MIQNIINRLHDTGYSILALTHTIYGKPHPDRDCVSKSLLPFIPDCYTTTKSKSAASALSSSSSDKQRQRRNDNNSSTSSSTITPKKNVTILKRAHIIIEELHDVSHYTTTPPPPSSPLSQYDLISLSARNDSIFSAICANALAADIITLDYGSRLLLPHKLKRGDVRAAIERGVSFEFCYGPAVVDGGKRKGFIRAVRDFGRVGANVQTVAVGRRRGRPMMILSSGSRVVANEDLGAMALRTPSDLANLLTTLTGLDDKMANDAMTRAPFDVLERRRDRERRGFSFDSSKRVEILGEDENDEAAEMVGSVPSVGESFTLGRMDGKDATKDVDDAVVDGDKDSDDAGDGFIAL